MRSIFTVLILFCIFITDAHSQKAGKDPNDVFSILATGGTQGQLVIEQEPAVKQMVVKYVDSRKKDNRLPGYRIRIYSNSGQSARQNAQNERARFLKSYPETPTYLEYEAPNFKIYVGDYRSRIEAFQAYKQIQREYRNAFLVPSRINLPKL